MKRLLVLLVLIISLLLPACSTNSTPLPAGDAPGDPSEDKPLEEVVIYKPSQPLTMEETIEKYFEKQYEAYANLKYIVLTSLLDMSEPRNRNSMVWLETLIHRFYKPQYLIE